MVDAVLLIPVRDVLQAESYHPLQIRREIAHGFLSIHIFLFCTHLILGQCLFQHFRKAPRHDFLVHAIF